MVFSIEKNRGRENDFTAHEYSKGAAQPQPVAMRAVSMADYKRKELQALAEAQSTAVLLLQTVENNEPPESAGGFLRFFKRKTHPEGMLAGKLAFTVLALGDSNLLLDRQTTTAADCTKCGQDLDSRLGYTRVVTSLLRTAVWFLWITTKEYNYTGWCKILHRRWLGSASSVPHGSTHAARPTSAPGCKRWSRGSAASGLRS